MPVSLTLGAAVALSLAADTARAPVPSDPAPPAAPGAPLVRVVADPASADTVAFAALGAELRMEAGEGRRSGDRSAPAELRVTRRVDGLTPRLAARLASGKRLAAVVVELPGGEGGDALRVRLGDVAVVATRLVVPALPADAEAQRLAQEVAVAQVEADRDEAARQLAEAEAIAEAEARDRMKLVPANALARARDHLRLLDTRLAAARRQRALVETRLARAAAPTEELTLRAERAEVLAAAPAVASSSAPH